MSRTRISAGLTWSDRRPRGRRGMPGELEQVVALVEREPQRAGDRADRLLGRPRAAALLEPRVEVGRHVRERRDLLAPQAGRPAPPAGAEADVVGLQRRAPAAQEVGKSVAVHALHDGDTAPAQPGTACPWLKRPLVAAAAASHHGRSMTKIALITGANRGIGRSTALHLARDGVDVILTYRSHADEAAAVVDEITALGPHGRRAPSSTSATQIGDASPPRVREALATTFGRDTFDYLVNNGGISLGSMIADVTEADVDALFDVHFKGVLFLTQKLLPLLADGGSIVNLSSGLARFTAPQRAVYGSIKAAVEVLTRYMAAELGPRGITANVIAPGPVATDFSGGMIRDNPEVQEHLEVADRARPDRHRRRHRRRDRRAAGPRQPLGHRPADRGLGRHPPLGARARSLDVVERLVRPAEQHRGARRRARGPRRPPSRTGRAASRSASARRRGAPPCRSIPRSRTTNSSPP